MTRDSTNAKITIPKERIAWVDYGKGLAIFLVFWGHSLCPEPIRAVYYAFHIPVFYFLSGYVFSTRKYRLFGPFLWHKLRTLIFPGLVFGVLGILFEWLNGFVIGKPYALHTLKLIIGIFVELRGGEYVVIPWFFASIFVVEVAAYWLFKWTHERVIVIVSLALFASVIGYGYATFIGKTVPWGLETACTGFGFFVMGYLSKQVWAEAFFQASRMVWMPLWLLLTATGTWLNVNVAGERLDVYLNHYGWYPFTMMGAVGGIMLMLGLLQALERHKTAAICRPLSALLLYVGRNSFILYSLNQVGLMVGLEAIEACGISMTSMTWRAQLLWGIVCVVIGVLFCVPFVEITNRWFPAIMGKKNVKS